MSSNIGTVQARFVGGAGGHRGPHIICSSLNICNDVTRTSLGKIEQNVLTRHFLASLHVCDTIVGLRLAYYDWLFELTILIQASV